MSTTVFPATPVVASAGSTDPAAPVVVLLHGRGADEAGIIGLASHLPHRFAYRAVRAPIAEGGGFAWFANRGIGRPIAESLTATMGWFRRWLDTELAGRSVVLVGFSGGAAFAGGLVLDDPTRYAGAAILYGTLPFDAGVPTTHGVLNGVPIMAAQGLDDVVIPRALLDRTWEYLHEESGAQITSMRVPGGHGITLEVVQSLAAWVGGLA
jgi:phospholipase/carboxylesterase